MPSPHQHADALPSVMGTLNYLGPMSVRPRSYAYPLDMDEPQRNLLFSPQDMPIHDLRPLKKGLSLDREGILLLSHTSAMDDYYDNEQVRRVAYAEISALIIAHTGAAHVIMFDHTVRHRVRSTSGAAGAFEPATGQREPDSLLHNDYTTKSGPQRARAVLALQDAEAVLPRRFALINVWRPIRGPVHDSPLAMADASTVDFDDLVGMDVFFPDRVGELYALKTNVAHRWYHVPGMLEHEVLLFKGYDSATDGRARFTPHAAFQDPTMPADALPRESIEFRALVLFEDND